MADVARVTHFHWTRQRSNAAILLSQGYTIEETASQCNCSSRSINRWKCDTEFLAEIDRLSLMVDIASRAERLRIAMRSVREKTKGKRVVTDKDVLDWLKFAQSETDGVKLDLTKVLASLSDDAAPVAGSGPAGVPKDGENSDDTRETTAAAGAPG